MSCCQSDLLLPLSSVVHSFAADPSHSFETPNQPQNLKMRSLQQLAVLALASTVIARALPQDDGDDVDGGDDGDDVDAGYYYPAPTTVKPTTVAPSTTKPWTTVPPSCTPTYEAYICDDYDGKGEYKTTFTLYPSGCPGYNKDPSTATGGPKSWYTWGKPVDPWAPAPVKPTTKPVDPWAPAPVKPTTKVVDPWAPYPNPVKPPKPVDPKEWDDWTYWVGKGGKPLAPKPTDPAKWDEWNPYVKVDGKTVVIITKTETYYVPCSTGWDPKTTVWYTTHCGCTDYPVPKTPEYTTYTTTCPESWGLGKTVVVSTPVCTYTPPAVVTPATATWADATVVKVDAASTWATTDIKKVDASSASTWATYGNPVSAASGSTWADVSPAAATGTWSPVGVWKGAASSNAMSKVMVLGAGAVAGLAYFL